MSQIPPTAWNHTYHTLFAVKRDASNVIRMTSYLNSAGQWRVSIAQALLSLPSVLTPQEVSVNLISRFSIVFHSFHTFCPCGPSLVVYVCFAGRSVFVALT